MKKGFIIYSFSAFNKGSEAAIMYVFEKENPFMKVIVPAFTKIDIHCESSYLSTKPTFISDKRISLKVNDKKYPVKRKI